VQGAPRSTDFTLSTVALAQTDLATSSILAVLHDSALLADHRALPSHLLAGDYPHRPDECQEQRGGLGNRGRVIGDVIDLESMLRTRCHDLIEAVRGIDVHIEGTGRALVSTNRLSVTTEGRPVSGLRCVLEMHNGKRGGSFAPRLPFAILVPGGDAAIALRRSDSSVTCHCDGFEGGVISRARRVPVRGLRDRNEIGDTSRASVRNANGKREANPPACRCFLE